ncbi:carboxypeptidase-like regulatory domain-containing protein [Maribacter aestuarii]|uniref:carboxypeptidase-like regulatory domain-containing protein n=1 Tax=Maribacter aestuarii TaxID=1130723 RepID=UPI0025A64126|nr:carboxypeptidase-like regulatory domain-containing protein [Maribacter aestuarii]
MRSKFLFFFFFGSVLLTAQTGLQKDLEGKVYSADGDVAATHVLNTTTQRATITDINGFFSIPVHVNDTLVFSAVQFKKKQVVVTLSIYSSTFLSVPLEDALTELDEVVVTPYNLSGDITKDITTLNLEPVVTASTLGLPNAYVKKMSQSERLLRSASYIPFEGTKLALDPIINSITGRTKMLKKRVERNNLYDRTERVRDFYADSLYRTELKIPEEKTDDFFYFCEVDSNFQRIVDTHDLFKIWEYLKARSVLYRENNDMD